ncbi:MAG: hypothetical protein AB7P03_26205 [Kofleriaceae bacterium]
MAACAVLATSACVIEDTGADLEIFNDSSYIIDQINLAEVNDPSWGPDLLHGNSLFPDESLVIHDIECGDYDVRVIDEFDVECVLYAVDLCLNSSVWTIDDVLLDDCAFNGP